MRDRKQPWADNWMIAEPLGQGGQGTTKIVRSLKETGKRGVLKILNKNRSQKARGRMRREVVSLDVLAKEGVKVPHVYESNLDLFDDPSVTLYFVMELIPGKQLTKVIEENSRLSLDKAAAYTIDLAATVAAAHKQDVLHRDLKPDNIIVRDFDKSDLVIVDYGLSYNEEDEEGPDLTNTSEGMRNRLRALPELNALGGDRKDKRSDITALAAILYYCLTGHGPGQLRDGKG